MSKQIESIKQAIGAAESSIRLSRQLLNELERGSFVKSEEESIPGVIGTFDGESMVMESGEKHLVPANYASKSMLIVGDTLKLVDGKGDKKFKQIEHVKRYKTFGVLTKKDGKFHVVTQEGSYRVIPAAVDHFNAVVGEEVRIVIPAKNLTAAWASIESTEKKEKSNNEQRPQSPVETKKETKDILKKETKEEVSSVEKKPKAKPNLKTKKLLVTSQDVVKEAVKKDTKTEVKLPPKTEVKTQTPKAPTAKATPKLSTGEDELT